MTTLPAQRTGFNTLHDWGHKTPTQSKRKRTGKKRLKVHGPEHVYNTLGYIWKHTHTHTHTHTDCSRNWVLILVGAEILWEEEGFQFGFKRWQGWAVSKVLWEWIPNLGSKARESAKSHVSCVCIAGFSACGCQKKSVVYGMECRHVAVQKGKPDQYHL